MSLTSKPTPRDDADAFVIEDLEKVYRTGEVEVRAVRGVSLTIPKGAFVVMLGASGSGKSTLLNIVGGLDRPTSGTVTSGGVDVTAMTDRELTRFRRDHVGFVFQFYNLMPSLTARENVALVTEIARDPMTPEEALGIVHLEKRMDHFPSQLSGGEQQRVAIARAIAKRPSILLCDEPTGALDSKTGVVVLEALKRANEEVGATTIVITHNAAIAQMADMVIHLADGAVREVIENTVKVDPAEVSW
jgi:putative ABC transport system ATP-binding protein